MDTQKPHATGCPVCGSSEIKSRGLCDKHYRRFMDRRKELPTQAEKDAFENKCLADGWIKPKTKGGRPAEDDDPFDAIANELAREAAKADLRAKAKGKAVKKRKRGAG